MTRHQIFGKSIIAAIFIIIAGGYLTFRGYKEKNDFIHLNSIIKYIGEKDPQNQKGNGKYRYLILEDYPGVFQIFVGKESGDFSPEYENLNQLNIGDTISVYYDESFLQKSQYNNLTRFIDKGDKAIFIEGGLDKSFGYFIIGLGTLLGILLLILKKKGKIE